MAKKSAGTLAIEKALKGLNSVGSDFVAPTYQAPDYNSIVNSHKVDYSKIFGNIDYTGVFDSPKDSGGGFKFPNILDVISGTIGQTGGASTNFISNIIDQVQKDSKNDLPWYEDVVNGLAGMNPRSVIENMGKSQISNWTDGKLSVKDIPFAGAFDKTGSLSGYNPLTSGLQGVTNGAKQQKENWSDGELSWGDIPSVGFLNGAEKGWKRGDDVLDQFGVKDGLGKTLGGLAIDIFADPLTYVGFGGTAALKAGKTAEKLKIAELSDALGINKYISSGLKNSDEFANVAKQAYKTKYPDWSDSVINKTVTKLTNQIKTAKNTAHNKAINDVVMSVPFTNKTMKMGQITNPKNLLYRSEATIGNGGKLATALIDDLSKNDPQLAKQLENYVLERYDVSDLSQLTKTMYNELHTKLSPVINKLNKLPDSKTTIDEITKHIPNEIFNVKTKKGMPNETVNYTKTGVDDLLTGMDPRVAKKVEPLLRGLENTPRTVKSPVGDLVMDGLESVKQLGPDAVKMFGEFAPKIMKTVKGKTADDVARAFSQAADEIANATHTATITKEADIPYKIYNKTVEILKGGRELDKAQTTKQVYKTIGDLKNNPFNEMSNTKTQLEHFLDGNKLFSKFNARTLGATQKVVDKNGKEKQVADKFVNSMGDVLSDANSQRVGETAMYSRDIAKVQKYMKTIPEASRDTVMKEAIYSLESKAPDALGKGWKPSQEAIGLARLIKPILNDIKKAEMDAGVLTAPRKNYFPHEVNKTAEQIKKIKEYKDANGDLNGLKLGNKNDKSRTGFQTLADKDNYIAKLEKAIQKETDPAVKEKMQEQLDEIADLFDTNVVSALTRRVKEGVRAKAMKAMNGELKKFGMYSDTGAGAHGLVKLDAAQIRKLGLKEGQEHWMHPEVLDGLKRTDELFTDKGMEKFARNLNAITDMFKSLVTTYKPSHYRNNIIGNTFVNMAAGVTPKDSWAAMKLLKGYKAGTLSEAEMKLVKTAYSKNVLSGGFVSDDMYNIAFDTPTMLEKAAQKVAHNKYTNTLKGFGEWADDQFRMANFINGMNKYGGDVDKAAGQVRKYLFNYNELTGADRIMRRIVPFWNWTKNNLPLQMNLLLENPKFALNITRFQDLFNKDQEGADYQKESGIKVPFTDYYTGISSPLGDLNLLLNGGTGLMNSTTPLIQIPASIWNNKDTFTKNPISSGSETTQPQDIPAYLASKMGITDNVWDAANGTKGIGESLINLFNPISEVREE